MNTLPAKEINYVSPVATDDCKRKAVRESNDEISSTNAKNCEQDSACSNECKVEGKDKTNANVITTLGPYDVIGGRTSKSFNNIGNKRFRVLMNMNLKRFVAEETKADKTEFIAALSKELTNEVGMRFLKEVQPKGTEKNKKMNKKGPNTKRFNNGIKKNGDTTQPQAIVQYVELSKKEIHAKVGHALRDLAFHASAAEENVSGNKNSNQRTTSPMSSLIERFGMLRSYEPTNAATQGFPSSIEVYPRPEFLPSFDVQHSFGSSSSTTSSSSSTHNQPSIKTVDASRDVVVPNPVSSSSDGINKKIWEEDDTGSINEKKRFSVSSVNSDAAFHECMNNLASLLFPSTMAATMDCSS